MSIYQNAFTPWMIGRVIRKRKGGCSHVKLERSMLKLNQSTYCRTSQSLECTNVHFESCGEAGGLWYGIVFSPWSYLAKLLLCLKLISALKSLMFLRTYSERQQFIIISHQVGIWPQWGNVITRIDIKYVAGKEAHGIHNTGSFLGKPQK